MPEGYEIIEEGEDIILKVDYEKEISIPSIEDSESCMAKTVELLTQVGEISKIIYFQKRDYEYSNSQTSLLKELAHLYKRLYQKKDLMSYQLLVSNPAYKLCLDTSPGEVQRLITRVMRGDPIAVYVELRRIERIERIRANDALDPNCQFFFKKFLEAIDYILGEFERTRLITLAKPYLAGFKPGDRSVYRRIFYPDIKPDFMFTKLMSTYPVNAEELDNYTIADGTEVTIFALPDSVQYLYHIMPPEFKLDEEQYEILDMARKVMAEHKPERSEFIDPQRMRVVFFNVGRDLIEELVDMKKYDFRPKEMDMLARILVRYTVGFGLVEVLLQDDKIQDISVNSPMGQVPIYIVHGEFDDCVTNIYPTKSESESWASKLRMISGRPLDEANPILDTELELPGVSTRVSTITKPLDPTGLAFSFRRHRDKPWTLPLFIKTGMVTPLAAGLISFLVDGTRTMLIAGTRSSGKSSLLSAVLIEIMRRYRIITVEDTLELPTVSMRKLGFNIQPMKVASALVKGSSEMNAADGIRSTLRLGDSSLIVGEVRSAEAKALYEAMRIGAAANVVAGTIHGDSPYGIYDRVVNDIGVPKTSFKATDICIIANPVKSADGLHKLRRVTQITEVRKSWENDPLTENGFADLMKYDAKLDKLVPSDELLNGDSEILKSIASNIKEFAGNWNAVWENIQLRTQIKETQVNLAKQMNDPDMLEAPFTIKCNDAYHNIIATVKDEIGSMDPKRVFFEWNNWMKREVKKRGTSEKM
ncbi:TPA: type II/IV secretion system ATPase subunit [Candidatus Woesearchaeota archaeon]|nr:type II/IV secretion system ATPase subunit [Candidatus Woesearchaeota archaeon]